jgi:hypothetical protein
MFDIEHERDGDTEEVEFQFSWKNDEQLVSARAAVLPRAERSTPVLFAFARQTSALLLVRLLLGQG